jgi:predicted kinase
MPSEASPVQRATTLRQYRNYANLAESYSTIPSRFLAITHGVSAVGKSHVAMRLVEALGAVRLRSDVERKRLFGEQQVENTPQAGIYAADASATTYTRLNEIAATVLRAGYPVVLDATFLKREQRDAAAKVAEATGAPFMILDCNAPQAVIASWLAQRQADKNDLSDATLSVIDEQQMNREPLTVEEQLLSKRVETNESGTLDALVAHIRQCLPGL